jgi:hypothetical protein
MGPPSYMRSVVDRNVVMRRIPVIYVSVGSSKRGRCVGGKPLCECRSRLNRPKTGSNWNRLINWLKDMSCVAVTHSIRNSSTAVHSPKLRMTIITWKRVMDVSEEFTASIIRSRVVLDYSNPEDGGTEILHNVAKYLPVYRASNFRRQISINTALLASNFSIYATVKNYRRPRETMSWNITSRNKIHYFFLHLCFRTSASSLQRSATKPRVNKIIDLYSKKQMGHINAFCGRNIEVCITKPRDACLVSPVLLRGKQ